MTVEFDSIVFELYINGAWTNISADVMVEPRPMWNNGIMGNGLKNRTAEPNNLTFSLKNGESSSGGLGYYSPGHANMRGGWRTGLPVRLSFVYEARDPYYKYYGVIRPDGINVIPGSKKERRVDVSCYGYMGRMAEHILDLLSVEESKTLEQAAALLLANMPIAPLAADYGTGQSVFSTVFDTLTTGTAAIAELDKLALSELGWAFTKGDRTGGETFTTRGRDDLASLAVTDIPKSIHESGYLLNETGGYLLNETGGKIILDEVTTASFGNDDIIAMETAYGKHYANRVKTNAYPRRVDAAATTVLWTLQNAIEIPANSTKPGIRGAYRDPTGGSKTVKGKSIVDPPVSGTDFTANSQSDGGGSSQTANMSVSIIPGAAEVEFSITNSSGASIWTGGDAGTLQVRGKGIYFYDTASNVLDDEELQEHDGLKENDFDMKYQDDPLVTEAFGEYALNTLKEKFTSVERITLSPHRDYMNMNAFLTLEPGTKAIFAESMSAINDNFLIMGYDAEIVAGKYVLWSPVLMREADVDFSLWENGYPAITEMFPHVGTGELTLTYSAAASGGAAFESDVTIPNHSTVWYITRNSSFANSGAFFFVLDTAYGNYTTAQGALDVVCDFSPIVAGTNTYIGGTDFPNYGAYLYCDTSLVLKGQVRNSGITTTATTYTLTAGTWYRGKMHINQAGTLATFYLYSEGGALLWTDSLSIGFASSQNLTILVQSTFAATGGSETKIMYLDYFETGYKHD